MNITKPIKCHNRVPMSRQYIYQLFIFRQQIPIFSSDTLLHFISKSLKNDGALLCPILFVFPNLWKMITNCCKLFLNMFWINFQASKSCYFSINTGFLTKKKNNYWQYYVKRISQKYISIYIYIHIYIYILCI